MLGLCPVICGFWKRTSVFLQALGKALILYQNEGAVFAVTFELKHKFCSNVGQA